jgi:[amino group carrier protein]-L-2-aminoadipate/L-glutamate 6-kinase
MTAPGTIVIKCGGTASLEPAALCTDVAGLAAAGRTVVLVHGGSADIERLAARLGVPMQRMASPDGLTARLTDPAALEVVMLALAGVVQPRLVTGLLAAGVPAVGLTGVHGGLLRARRRRAQRALAAGRQVVVRGDHSGRITGVNTGLLDCLTGADFVPVVSPPVLAEDGSVLNADADRVAAAVAGAIRASALLLLTGAPGVLADPADPRSALPVCPVPPDGPPPQRFGGIGVKLLAARDALAAGVPDVLIAGAAGPRPASRALSGAATRVRLAAADVAVPQ